jgi:hypothetical protein
MRYFFVIERGDAETRRRGELQQQPMVNSTPTKFLLFSVLRVSASPRSNNKKFLIR